MSNIEDDLKKLSVMASKKKSIGKTQQPIKTIEDEWHKYIWEQDKIWKPPYVDKEDAQKEAQRRAMEDIKKHWEHHQKDMDPVDRLRRELRKELDEIKDAIRKIGILLDSDAPSEEMMKKHKALREAYLKYKMMEKLILGGEGKGEGDDGG